MLWDFKQGTHSLWAPASSSISLSASTFIALPQSPHCFLVPCQVSHLLHCPTWSLMVVTWVPWNQGGMWRLHLPPKSSPSPRPHRSSSFCGEWLCVFGCVCLHGVGGIWKIPKLRSSVASGFSCLPYPSSLSAFLPEAQPQALSPQPQSTCSALDPCSEQLGTLRGRTCPSSSLCPLTLGTWGLRSKRCYF